MNATESAPKPSGRYDSAARKRGTRAGRRTGCYIYIPGEMLHAMGFAPDEPPPSYVLWNPPDGRPRVMVNLFREP